MRKLVTAALTICVACSSLPEPNREGTKRWYHKNGPATTMVRSGSAICGGWWSGPSEITTAAHCYDGEFQLEGGLQPTWLDVDFGIDVMKIGVKGIHYPWLPTAEPDNDTVVHIVNPGKGIVLTRVASTGKDNVELEWTAAPGWSGSPAINEKGETVCMVVAYFLVGGTKCVKVR